MTEYLLVNTVFNHAYLRGDYNFILGNITKTVDSLNSDLKTSTTPNTLEIITITLCNILGYGYSACAGKGMHEQSLEFANKAVQVGLTLEPDSLTVMKAYNNRALAHQELGMLKAALDDLEIVMNAVKRRKIEDAQFVRAITSNYEQLYTTMFDSCEREYLTGDDTHTLNQNGLLALRRGQNTKAISFFIRAKKISRNENISAIIDCNLGSAYTNIEDYDQGIKHLKLALEAHSRLELLEPLAKDHDGLTGIYLLLKDYQQAAYHAKCAWEAMRVAAPNSPDNITILKHLADIRFIERDHTRARACLKKAIAIYEKTRINIGKSEVEHQKYFLLYRDSVELLLFLSVNDGWFDEVLDLIERAKSRIWHEKIIGLKFSTLVEPNAEYRPKKESPNHTETVDTSLEEDTNIFQIGKDNYGLKSLSGIDTLLINFFVGRRAIFVTYCNQGKIGCYRVDCKDNDLASMINDFNYDILKSKSRSSKQKDLGPQLYQVLFKKLPENISTFKKIIISPDGPLWYLPFSLLPFSTKKILDYAIISYVPSFSLALHRLRKSDPLNDFYLIVGNPTYDDHSSEIPGTKLQISTLREILPENQSIFLESNRATATHLKHYIAQATYIHIAAHAVGNLEGDETPYILLSDGNRSEPFSIADLHGVSIYAKVVFLSACSTSIGAVSPGEGLMSIAREFLFCGAKCVIASLWPMYDDEMAIFVGEFYKFLVTGDDVYTAMAKTVRLVRSAGVSDRTLGGLQVIGLAGKPEHLQLDDILSKY